MVQIQQAAAGQEGRISVERQRAMPDCVQTAGHRWAPIVGEEASDSKRSGGMRVRAWSKGWQMCGLRNAAWPVLYKARLRGNRGLSEGKRGTRTVEPEGEDGSDN